MTADLFSKVNYFFSRGEVSHASGTNKLWALVQTARPFCLLGLLGPKVLINVHDRVFQAQTPHLARSLYYWLANDLFISDNHRCHHFIFLCFYASRPSPITLNILHNPRSLSERVNPINTKSNASAVAKKNGRSKEEP